MFSPGWDITAPPMVSAYTNGIGWVNSMTAGVPASAAWPTADLAIYYPLILTAPCVVRRVWWANGATTAGATVDVGVYADSGYGPGVKLVSGSAAQGTANQVQFVDVTDTTLAPGLYWLAIASSSATSTTFMRGQSSVIYDGVSMLEQASARPLPATATPVEATASANYCVVVCGFATTA